MRVPRTFVFVDLSGFTNYTGAFGDDAAARLLSAFRTTVRQIASERGVRIVKWLGDGCMVVAVDQSEAVAFTLDLRERAARACAPLTARAGIASGFALLFEGDDYIGSAVNMASRLCDAADRSQVLIPAAGLGQLPDGVTASPAGTFELAGFPTAVDVVELAGTPVPPSRHDIGEPWRHAPAV